MAKVKIPRGVAEMSQREATERLVDLNGEISLDAVATVFYERGLVDGEWKQCVGSAARALTTGNFRRVRRGVYTTPKRRRARAA